MSTKQSDISQLIETMAALCNPVDGSARDLEQDVSAIRQYTIEEACEIRSDGRPLHSDTRNKARRDRVALHGELGTILNWTERQAVGPATQNTPGARLTGVSLSMVLGPGFGFCRALLVGKRPVEGLEETATKIVPISSRSLDPRDEFGSPFLSRRLQYSCASDPVVKCDTARENRRTQNAQPNHGHDSPAPRRLLVQIAGAPSPGSRVSPNENDEYSNNAKAGVRTAVRMPARAIGRRRCLVSLTLVTRSPASRLPKVAPPLASAINR
jgi:NTP pyrophosphatase (non-canonical NTP hydrolase)